MRVRKWLMKQQWRIVQIRGIWSLFYGILMLAYAYYAVIPFFYQMGTVGPFGFAVILLALFLFLGYLYDRVFVMWAPSQEVTMERNPFQYVPSPKDHIFLFPLYSALLTATETLAERFDVDTSIIKETKQYFGKLEKLTPMRKEDIEEAIKLRNEFIAKHPFLPRPEELTESTENI